MISKRRTAQAYSIYAIVFAYALTCPAVAGGALHPLERLTDPNPPVPLHDLEKSITVEEIDEILNHVTGTDGGIITQRFRPHPFWLWRQWYGTVLYHTSKHAILNMMYATLWCVLTRYHTSGDWKFWILPVKGAHPRLEVVDKIWRTLMSLTTFLLTFFVGQAYTFWRTVHDQGRGIQGRMNDINMLMATHATRQTETGSYTKEASDALVSLADKLRGFHLLFWASNARRFRILLTRQGMERLVQVGFIEASTKERLDEIDLPPTLKWASMLESAIKDCHDGIRDWKVISHYSVALEQVLLDQFCRLRGLCATIPDLIDGRMPLAYAHFVQILVDSFLFVAPIAQ